MTDLGEVIGSHANRGTVAFLGVPFAEPPVDQLRWAATMPAEPWEESFVAQSLAPACPQLGAMTDPETGETESVPIGDEDCLYLNVWRPREEAEAPRPVMVFIHGGGNVQGTANNPLYDGANLAAEGDVLVFTVQYRLNALGWLNHPDLHTGESLVDSGNFGMLDLMEALRWVQRNAAAFGGDPSRVTLFGESAGGFDIWSLILSPLAEGLFDRGIIESGCPVYKSVEDAQVNSQALVELLVVADGLATVETAAEYIAAQQAGWVNRYLRSKTAAEIMQTYADNGGLELSYYDPIEDGYVLPMGTLDRLYSGDFRHTPTIIGSNRDEMKLFLSSYYGMGRAQFNALMVALYGDNASDIIDLYPISAYSPASYYNQFADIQDWYLELLCSTWAGMVTSAHQPVWSYSFHYDALAPPLGDVFGAAHGLELPFVFGNMTDELYASGTGPERLALFEAIADHWSCFAREGEPDVCGGAAWPQMASPGEWLQMIFDAPATVQPVSDAQHEQLSYWLELGGLPEAAPPATPSPGPEQTPPEGTVR